MSTPLTLDTNVVVRVIARDGKFLGDDIGGAHITIRDSLTRAILAEGRTSGGSGANGQQGVMCLLRNRSTPIPVADASSFTAALPLDGPRRIEVTAYGPLGALGSANTASATQWVYPGKPVNGGDGFLLELSGLIVQIVNPVTHYAPAKAPGEISIIANVAMMCGCPISDKVANAICPGDSQPWLPKEFEVAADVRFQAAGSTTWSTQHIDMTIDSNAGTAGIFRGTLANVQKGTYQITVYAYQASTGNTGVDTATVFLNASQF